MSALKKQIEPKSLIIAEHFHFHRRNQSATETVVEYVSALKKVSRNCAFEAYLNKVLRDRFICGLHHEVIQR